MSTDLVPLALLMAAATYPSRALPLLVPGMHRLPAPALAYLRLVGPAVLAALAAVDTLVDLDAQRVPSLHVGIEWLAVGAAVALVALRRGLLTGTVVAALIAAAARAGGLA
jgi:branched-subunit amino acid transport protein